MAGSRCAVPGCGHSFGRVGKLGISFHSFPVNPTIRKQWISICKKKNKWNPESARICSAHFKPKDFLRDLQAELLGYKPKRRLAPGSVPSLNIPYDPSLPKTETGTRRQERMAAKMGLREHRKLLEEMGISSLGVSHVNNTKNSDGLSCESVSHVVENEDNKRISCWSISQVAENEDSDRISGVSQVAENEDSDRISCFGVSQLPENEDIKKISCWGVSQVPEIEECDRISCFGVSQVAENEEDNEDYEGLQTINYKSLYEETKNENLFLRKIIKGQSQQLKRASIIFKRFKNIKTQKNKFKADKIKHLQLIITKYKRLARKRKRDVKNRV